MNGVDQLLERVRRARTVPPQERKRIRTEAGISARVMGEALGVSHAAVMNWEKGRYDPRDAEQFDAYFDLLERIDQILKETNGAQ